MPFLESHHNNSVNKDIFPKIKDRSVINSNFLFQDTKNERINIRSLIENTNSIIKNSSKDGSIGKLNSSFNSLVTRKINPLR